MTAFDLWTLVAIMRRYSGPNPNIPTLLKCRLEYWPSDPSNLLRCNYRRREDDVERA